MLICTAWCLRRLSVFILISEFILHFKRDKALEARWQLKHGWESLLLDQSRFHSHSLQTTPQSMSHIALAKRSDARWNTWSALSTMALFLHSSLPEAGKYTLLLETLPQQRMGLWNGKEDGSQGFRGSWAQSCCDHRRFTYHLLVSTCLLKMTSTFKLFTEIVQRYQNVKFIPRVSTWDVLTQKDSL